MYISCEWPSEPQLLKPLLFSPLPLLLMQALRSGLVFYLPLHTACLGQLWVTFNEKWVSLRGYSTKSSLFGGSSFYYFPAPPPLSSSTHPLSFPLFPSSPSCSPFYYALYSSRILLLLFPFFPPWTSPHLTLTFLFISLFYNSLDQMSPYQYDLRFQDYLKLIMPSKQVRVLSLVDPSPQPIGAGPDALLNTTRGPDLILYIFLVTTNFQVFGDRNFSDCSDDIPKKNSTAQKHEKNIGKVYPTFHKINIFLSLS